MMKIAIVIVTLIAFFLVLLLITGLFIRKEYSVAREIIIRKTKETVFDYIKLLANQNLFSTWALMDPNMTKEFRGTDGKVGFVSSWDSQDKNVGKGEQEIIKIINGERIDYEIRFIKPFKSTNYSSITTEIVSENQTRLKWEFNAKMKYPLNLMLLVMNIEKMIGSDLEKGLINLKTLLEK